MKIEIELTNQQLDTIKMAFPEKQTDAELKETGAQISMMILDELLQLLSGKIRYLSLSHQYIEWIQELYKRILPNDEFEYRRINENFNFPPGQAAYISRILQSRQNTHVHQNAKENLKIILNNQKTEFEALSAEDKQGNENRVFILTKREFEILREQVAELIIKGNPISNPELVDYIGKDRVRIKFLIENINQILNK